MYQEKIDYNATVYSVKTTFCLDMRDNIDRITWLLKFQHDHFFAKKVGIQILFNTIKCC